MKQMKVLILIFAVVSLASLFIPMEGFTFFAVLQLGGMSYLAPVLGGFALALVGGFAAMKSPAPTWCAPAAVLGFAAAFVRLEMWKVGDLMGGPLPAKLLVVGVFGGLAVSIVGLVKPEQTA